MAYLWATLRAVLLCPLWGHNWQRFPDDAIAAWSCTRCNEMADPGPHPVFTPRTR